MRSLKRCVVFRERDPYNDRIPSLWKTSEPGERHPSTLLQCVVWIRRTFPPKRMLVPRVRFGLQCRQTVLGPTMTESNVCMRDARFGKGELALSESSTTSRRLNTIVVNRVWPFVRRSSLCETARSIYENDSLPSENTRQRSE